MAYINGKEVLFSTKVIGFGNDTDVLKGLIEGSITELVIPEGATKIKLYCFQYCTSLKKITIPNSVMSIGMGVVTNCTALETITFEGKPETINKIALSSNATLIVCPWKEGEVEGAPWGATKATIKYTG